MVAHCSRLPEYRGTLSAHDIYCAFSSRLSSCGSVPSLRGAAWERDARPRQHCYPQISPCLKNQPWSCGRMGGRVVLKSRPVLLKITCKYCCIFCKSAVTGRHIHCYIHSLPHLGAIGRPHHFALQISDEVLTLV